MSRTKQLRAEPRNRVILALTVNEVCDLLKPFGGPTTRAAYSLWLKRGHFPNAFKGTEGKNSRWYIPLSDVIRYTSFHHPSGPPAETYEQTPTYLKPTCRHIMLTNWGLDPELRAKNMLPQQPVPTIGLPFTIPTNIPA